MRAALVFAIAGAWAAGCATVSDLAPSSAAAAQSAGQTSGPASRQMQITSDQAWQDTGIDVTVGTQLRITASGTVVFDSAGSAAGPDGSGRGSALANSLGQCTYVICGPSFQQQALVGRIGSSSLADFSTGFTVASSFNSTVTTAGRLFLAFNDGFVRADRGGLDTGGVGDNRGSFAVSITATRP